MPTGATTWEAAVRLWLDGSSEPDGTWQRTNAFSAFSRWTSASAARPRRSSARPCSRSVPAPSANALAEVAREAPATPSNNEADSNPARQLWMKRMTLLLCTTP